MKNFYFNGSKKTMHRIIIFLCTLVLVAITQSKGQAIVTYATGGGQANDPSRTFIAANINTTLTSAALVRNNGVSVNTTACTNGMSNNNWTAAGGGNSTFNFNSTGYVSFTVIPNTGYQFTISSISAVLRNSTTGPPNYDIYYSTDGGGSWIGKGAATNPANGSGCQTTTTPNVTWAINPVINSTNGIMIRIYGWGASGATGNFQMFYVQLNGSSSCSSPVAPTVTTTQPSLCGVSTGTITVTAPAETGMTYSKDGSTYQASATFSTLAAATYNITAKNSCGSVSPITSVTINSTLPTNLTKISFKAVLAPKYMTTGDATRLPYFYRATVSGLCANTTYRYFTQAANSSDFGTANPGAGNTILINPTGTTFTYTSGPALTSAGNYETFTSDASGNYTGWFGFVHTSNARFDGTNPVYPTIVIGDNSGNTKARLALDSSITVLTYGTTGGSTTQCTGIYGKCFENGKSFVLLYSDTGGITRPLAITGVENLQISSPDTKLVAYYNTNVVAKSSMWGTIIPNSLPTGVRRIEYRRFDGNITYAVMDDDGSWVISGAGTTTSTVNSNGGSTAKALTYNGTYDYMTVYNGEAVDSTSKRSYQNTTSINNPNNTVLTLQISKKLTINPGAKLSIGPNAAETNILSLTGIITGKGKIMGSTTSTVNVGGSAGTALGTMYFDQSVPGTTNQLKAISLSRGNLFSTATLGSTLQVTTSVVLTAGALVLSNVATDTFRYSGSAFTSFATGTITGSNTSNMEITGINSGTIGPIYFTAPILAGDLVGGQILRNFNVDRNNGANVKLGTNLEVDGACTLKSGTLDINGNTLTLSGTYKAADVSAPTKRGTITGSSTSSLVVGMTAISVPLTFTYDAAGSKNCLKTISVFGNASLENNGTNTSSLNIIAGTASTPGTVIVDSGAVFATNDSLTLKSDINGTAQVAANIYGTSTYITGKVMIERYIDSYRAWRLLTAPLSTRGQTIKQAWQENTTNNVTTDLFNNVHGYGTEITNVLSTVPSATGYDKSATNNPSLMYMDVPTQKWKVPGRTDTTDMTTFPGYMIFIRGDRSVLVQTPPANTYTSTILRSKGTIKQGTLSLTVGNGFNVIGNPYPSEYIMDSLIARDSPKVGQNYTVWDPKGGHNNVGYYTYLAFISPGFYSSWSVAPQSAFVKGRIESGQAFIMNGKSGTAHFLETDKATTSAMVFRPVNVNDVQEFGIQLSAVNPDEIAVVDGALALYGPQYSDGVNWLEDAQKIPNPGENISIIRDGKSIAIDKTTELTVTDTIYLSLKGTSQKTYQFAFGSLGLSSKGFDGILIDNFTGKRSLISLDGDTTKVNFTITSDAASQAVNRFKIVFVIPDGGPLPVTFTAIKAWKQNAANSVQWNVANETGVKQYEVQKSTDGINFINAGVVNAGNNKQYTWIDNNITTAQTYYRIISVDVNGAQHYSTIVKVTDNEVSNIILTSNPVKNNMIQLQFINKPTGNYKLTVFNAVGQQIAATVIKNSGNVSMQSMPLPKGISKGVYEMEVKQINSTDKITFPILIQ
ncbi:beta strand repeat-containing protein [Ferruginibacter albus]|uniref:beta strand repeat-containing protein n=1 Tax=Ferruginibacter albus TaxID=2875540 RepID=UPI001CC4FF56|nr:hypothetical protein [Ferruginibacter albus]UAY51310.1 hypothetical protein K9M53_12000 [Ferruginibacter albus]